MNKVLLLNVVWLAVAAATFFIGRNTAQQDGSSDQDNNVGMSPGSPSILASGRGSEAETDKNPDTGSTFESQPGNASMQPAWMTQSTPLTVQQMEDAMAEVARETDPLRRASLFSQLLERLTPDNAAMAYETLRSKGTGWENRQNIALLSYAWGRMDPTAAMKSVSETGGMGAAWTKSAVLSGWASRDSDAAIAWVEGQEDPNQQEKMAMNMGLINGLARSDPDKAVEYLMASDTPGNMRSRLINPIVEEQLKKGTAEAANWALTLPEDDGMRGEALDNIAQRYVKEDPEAAKEWITKYAGDEFSRRAVGEVAETLARSDPGDALNWVNSLPEGTSRSKGYEQVFQEWAREDADAAGTVLGQLDDSAEKNAAVQAFAREITRQDPISATNWANIITDEEMREETLVSSARQWQRQDPEGASKWLTENNIPAETVEKINQSGGGAGWMDRIRAFRDGQ